MFPAHVTSVQTEQWLAAQHLRDLATIDAQADLIATLEAERSKLRREVMILTARWAKD